MEQEEEDKKKNRKGRTEEGDGERARGLYGVHQMTFDLLLSAGRCHNKLPVVKGLDTSWHLLQKSSGVLPVRFGFSMADRRVMAQSLFHACTSGWQHLG